MADCLLKHASGQERDDDVQDTLLRLHRRLGPDALLEDAIRLGRFILSRCRIDRLGRRTLELLGDGDDEAVRPMVGDADLGRRSRWNRIHSSHSDLGRVPPGYFK